MKPPEELPKNNPRLPGFYIVGNIPVQLHTNSDGTIIIRKFNLDTGFFVDEAELLTNVVSASDAKSVSEDDFIQHTERLRRERFKGRTTVFTLYEMLNNLEFMAAAQKRLLTDAEKKLIAIAQRKTFQLFETQDGPR